MNDSAFKNIGMPRYLTEYFMLLLLEQIERIKWSVRICKHIHTQTHHHSLEIVSLNYMLHAFTKKSTSIHVFYSAFVCAIWLHSDAGHWIYRWGKSCMNIMENESSNSERMAFSRKPSRTLRLFRLDKWIFSKLYNFIAFHYKWTPSEFLRIGSSIVHKPSEYQEIFFFSFFVVVGIFGVDCWNLCKLKPYSHSMWLYVCVCK